jgi:hypothetical protein
MSFLFSLQLWWIRRSAQWDRLSYWYEKRFMPNFNLYLSEFVYEMMKAYSLTHRSKRLIKLNLKSVQYFGIKHFFKIFSIGFAVHIIYKDPRFILGVISIAAIYCFHLIQQNKRNKH